MWPSVTRETVDYAAKVRKLRKEGKVVSRGSDFVLPKDKHQWKFMVDISLGYPICTMSQFKSVIPPGGHTTYHRHPCEAIIHVVKGRGYSRIDGRRFEWSAGDSICVPYDSWHQHFNKSKTQPVECVATINSRLMSFLGLFEYDEKPKIVKK